jgi:NAD(P)-dependent dehydrogenase (short-subunit alcohol dehydrogenase family)
MALDGKTAIVVGASRGFGRGVAEALARAGADVVAVARDRAALAELAAATPGITPWAADATDAVVAGKLLDEYRPDVLVLVAGANPLSRPLHLHTWETFSVNWNTDVRLTFAWLREALSLPLRPTSRIVVFSSGAAVNGSPVSGGYAGSKATQRFMAAYAQDESNRASLGLTVTALLPKISPATELGRDGIRAYAARDNITEGQFRKQLGGPVTPEKAGTAVLELVTTTTPAAAAYLLTSDGLQPLR